jgi:hypothetical protein
VRVPEPGTSNRNKHPPRSANLLGKMNTSVASFGDGFEDIKIFHRRNDRTSSTGQHGCGKVNVGVVEERSRGRGRERERREREREEREREKRETGRKKKQSRIQKESQKPP